VRDEREVEAEKTKEKDKASSTETSGEEGGPTEPK